MKNAIIDQKNQSKTVKKVFVTVESINTTLTLQTMDNGKIGIAYQCRYSGIYDGNTTGGPTEVSGNESKLIHNNPDIKLSITNYQKSESYVAMHIKIDVDSYGIGTIFDQTLGGQIPKESGWKPLFAHLDSLQIEEALA